jgi:hypothetical protein
MVRNLGLWFGLLLLYAFILNLLIHCLIKYFKKNSKDITNTEEKKMGEKIAWLGFFELFSYILSIVLGYPQFIAVWVGVRTLGRWHAHETKAATINFFLLGTLLSILAGVLGGIIFINFAGVLSLPLKNYLSSLMLK